MTAKLKIALVGAGAMGSLHARVLSQHPLAVLSAVIDPAPGAARAVAARYGSAVVDELPASCDAVIVAAPTEVHTEWTRRALERGLPTLVEKPMATDLADVELLLREAERRDVPLACGFIERWNPAVMLAAEVMPEPLVFQAVRHSPYVARIRGGVAEDLLIHDVDIALRTFGAKPHSVRASRGFFHPESARGAEDVAEVHLSFAGGQLATASASRIAQQKVRQIRLHDLDRTVEIDLLRQDVAIYRHVGHEFEETGAYRRQTVIDAPVVPNRREPLLSQLDHFVALARGQADHAAERAGILPPHAVIDAVLAHDG